MKSRQGAIALMVAALAIAVGTIVLATSSDDDDVVAPPPTESVTTSSTALDGATPSSSTATTAPGAPAVGELRLTPGGLGPVRVGMTVADATAALGRTLQALGVDPTGSNGCEIYAPQGGPDGVGFMVTAGTIARVDVIGGPVQTTEGLAIGQTEAEAQQRYGGRLAVTPHKYTEGGHYLTLVPTDPADASLRIVAETDGTVVTALRSGRLPEVEFVEGCS